MDYGIEERKYKADLALRPSSFYSYILQFDDDGSFYVGSTNSPLARFSEHAIGVGAKATSGRSFTIRLILPFLSRREAEYNEQRLQAALAKGPVNIETMIKVFNRIINIVRPEKTFSQLRDEERKYRLEMESVFHHSTNLVGGIVPPKPTACGWKGEHYGTSDWAELKKMAGDEDFTGNVYGRRVCRACLEHAPVKVAG